MRNLYVVTHPEATHHTEGLVGGWYDSALTPAGTAAAGSIAAALRARIPAGVRLELFSSDLQRARQTAAAISEHLEVGIVADRRLRERSYGEAEGKPAGLDQRFTPPPAAGDRLHHHDGVPGSETTWSFARRVYAVTDEILASECEHQIVVTHGGVVTFLLAAWIKMPVEATGHVLFRAAPGSITELRQDDVQHARQVLRLGDVSHLGVVLPGR